LVVLAAVSVVLLAGVYLVAVHTEWGQRVDDAALDGRTTRAGVQHATTRLLDTISVSSLVLGTGAVVVIALARRRPHLAFTAVVVIFGANVSTQLLKKVVLDRPDLGVHEDVHEMSNWFPSGHATVAMSLAIALVLVVSINVRPWAALGGVVYATLVGAGTVTAGWHRPSDVIGAYLVVTAWTGTSVAALIWAEGAERARPSDLLARVPTLSPFLGGLGIGVLVGAMFGVAGTLVAARTRQLDAVQLGAAYAAAIAVIAGSALVVLVAVLAALRGVSLDPPHLTDAGLDGAAIRIVRA
jgi:membrane-associated phospholipid phosphatase